MLFQIPKTIKLCTYLILDFMSRFILKCSLFITLLGFGCFVNVQAQTLSKYKAPAKKLSGGIILQTEKIPGPEPKDKKAYGLSYEYIIAPGDTLAYKEFTHPKEFQQSSILVTPDGYASFEPLGSFKVSGKTISQVTKILEEKIAYYLVEPKVTLGIVRTHPGIAYLSGAVVRPGMIQLATYHGNAQGTMVDYGEARLSMRIMNVIHLGGGIMPNADLENVIITRNKNESKIKVNLLKALRGEDSSQDVWIEYNDRIFVPFLPIEKQKKMSNEEYRMILQSVLAPPDFPVRVIGWVEKPNVYLVSNLSPYLNSAIAQASGFLNGANKQKIVVRRFYDQTHFQTLVINPHQEDFLLRPNDVIYVPELKIYKAGRLMEQVTRILSPFTSFTNTIASPVLITNR